MRRLMTAVLVVAVMCGLSFVPAPRGSVMAGIGSVVAPVAHAQFGGNPFMSCDELFQVISDLEFQGWYVQIISSNLTQTFYFGLQLREYGVVIWYPGNTPGLTSYIDCIDNE